MKLFHVAVSHSRHLKFLFTASVCQEGCPVKSAGGSAGAGLGGIWGGGNGDQGPYSGTVLCKQQIII